jgi:carbamoylphosphate synthase large subunit
LTCFRRLNLPNSEQVNYLEHESDIIAHWKTIQAEEYIVSSTNAVSVLCLASYFKGTTFLEAAKQNHARVILMTRDKLADEAWPRESIDEIYFMPSLSKRPDIFYAVSYLTRTRNIDCIVPLDDYDVETAAALREHLRLSGLGDTAVRYFRDKLAMRFQGQLAGLNVPPFSPVFSYARLQAFMERESPPWVLKPRSEAGAMGIKKVNSAEEVWRWLDQLGDEQSFFHLEKFISGEIYHVDSLVYDRKVVLAVPHKYARPPMNVAHEGGIFISRTLTRDSEEAKAIIEYNRQMIAAFQLERGATHAEFIKGQDGRLYFLETAARVGGANIEQLVEAASGANLWGEWAKMEIAHVQGEPYHAPEDRRQYAGVLICLARQEWPDLSTYDDPEIVYHVQKKNHAGLILASSSAERIEGLIGAYGRRFAQDFLAVMPALDKPPQ